MTAVIDMAATWFAPTKEQVERYAEFFRKWGLHGMKENENPKTQASLNDPVGVPFIPETFLWQSVLQESILDATGQGQQSDKLCFDCHKMDIHCGCYARLVTKEDFNWEKSTEDIYWFKRQRQGITPWCSAKNVVEVDGKWYWRGLRSDCKKAHTNQDCAQKWFNQGGHRWICEGLGLDPDYVLRKVNQLIYERGEEWI